MHSLSREVVDATSPEVSKAKLDEALGSLSQWVAALHMVDRLVLGDL